MADELPGFIPQVLRLANVSLLRADETVLNAMVDGWRAQMLARGLAVDTIKGRCAVAAANACLHALSSNMSATFLPSLSVRAAVTSLATCSQIPSGA